MIVLSLTNCPSSLRGDLTRWLFEVDVNLYVGKLSSRVRAKIWERVTSNSKTGRAVMVYPAGNEQGFDFLVWGTSWDPIDYDGLKLMLRPHPGDKQTDEKDNQIVESNVEKRMAAKRFAKSKRHAQSLPESYIVVDVETTGLSVEKDDIIELGSIKVIDGQSVDNFHAIVRIDTSVPTHIEKLTGITNELIEREGRGLSEIINEFKVFAGDYSFVSHNVEFDFRFLCKAFEQNGLSAPINARVDILRIAQSYLDNPGDYKLESLAKLLQIEYGSMHRSLEDCEVIWRLYEKLRNIIINPG